ncbi:MAG TPA: hypothetical protein VIK21_07555, partial [Desulfuromonadaceae bacterium]
YIIGQMSPPSRSSQNDLSPFSIETFLGLSILQSIIFTFFPGKRSFGGTRVYWYASVEMILSGNLSATLLTNVRNDPIPIGEYKSSCVPYILLPGVKAENFSFNSVHFGQRQ